MKLINLFEDVNVAYLYHGTSRQSLIDIFTDHTLIAKEHNNRSEIKDKSGNLLKGICFSRNPRFLLTSKDDDDDHIVTGSGDLKSHVVLIFDRKIMSHHYKINLMSHSTSKILVLKKFNQLEPTEEEASNFSWIKKNVFPISDLFTDAFKAFQKEILNFFNSHLKPQNEFISFRQLFMFLIKLEKSERINLIKTGFFPYVKGKMHQGSEYEETILTDKDKVDLKSLGFIGWTILNLSEELINELMSKLPEEAKKFLLPTEKLPVEVRNLAKLKQR